MKRSLPIAGKPSDVTAPAPSFVELGGLSIRIVDAHDGAAAKRFGELLIRQGARELEGPVEECALTIVIRSTPRSPEAHLRAEVLEETADLVLGSPREAFARELRKRLAG